MALIGAAGVYFFRQTIEYYYVAPFMIGFICLPMIALGDTLDGTALAVERLRDLTRRA
jgi:hypothetical protein